jgi:hypothetical protein
MKYIGRVRDVNGLSYSIVQVQKTQVIVDGGEKIKAKDIKTIYLSPEVFFDLYFKDDKEIEEDVEKDSE